MSSEGVESRMAPVSPETFRHACGRFATGVAIAAVLDEAGVPHGLTVSSFASVSLEPPLVLVCLGHAVTNIEEFRRSRYFSLSFLRHEQLHLSNHFARKGYDRFTDVPWCPGDTGAPLIQGALGTLECALYQRFTSGDHDIFVGEVVRARATDGAPLIHYAGRYGRLAEE